MARYWWRFLVKGEDGDECYLGSASSYPDLGDPFIGTTQEADAEADRRADAWQARTGGWACRLTLERRGEVKGE